MTEPLQLIVPSGEVQTALPGSGVISPDPDLAGLNPTAIAGATGGGGQLFKEGIGPSGNPKKVPAPVLIFWTVIAPLVVALGSATMFLRLRPKALTVRVPAPR